MPILVFFHPDHLEEASLAGHALPQLPENRMKQHNQLFTMMRTSVGYYCFSATQKKKKERKDLSKEKKILFFLSVSKLTTNISQMCLHDATASEK